MKKHTIHPNKKKFILSTLIFSLIFGAGSLGISHSPSGRLAYAHEGASHSDTEANTTKSEKKHSHKHKKGTKKNGGSEAGSMGAGEANSGRSSGTGEPTRTREQENKRRVTREESPVQIRVQEAHQIPAEVLDN